MKIYVFNLKEEWTPYGAKAIVAESEEEAIKIYGLPDSEYTVESVAIRAGLVLEADGYDDVTISWMFA